MAAETTLNTVIHAAFRRDLQRFDDAFAHFVDGDTARARNLGIAWDNLENQLRRHHHDEETIFWPALNDLGADQALVGELGAEHERMLIALDQASAAMKAFADNPSSDNVATARATVAELRTVLEEHLAHEERDLEGFAASHIKSKQIQAAQKEVRRQAKGEGGTFFAWLQDGADQRTLQLLRHEVPPPVLFVMTTLGGRDYRRRVASVWT